SEYTDTETGYQYLRARYYDPTTGQFTTRDPITPLTRSPHAYVGSNPLNLVDPIGAWGIPPSWSGIVNPGTVATSLAVVACIVGGFALCVGASMGAWVARSLYRIDREGWNDAKGDIALDLLL